MLASKTNKIDFSNQLHKYYSKCIDSIIILIDFLIKKNNIFWQINSNNEPNKLLVFGSSINYFLNKEINTERIQDLDLLLEFDTAFDLIHLIREECKSVKIIDDKRRSSKYCTTFLKYQGINKIINIEFKSIIDILKLLRKINLKLWEDFKEIELIEKKIKDHFIEDYIFSIDICIPIIHCGHKVITKFGNSLLSSKKHVLNVICNTKNINKLNSFNEFDSELIIENIIYKKYEYKLSKLNKVLFYERTIGSLVYLLTLMSKIFGMNGIRDRDLRIVKKIYKQSSYNDMKIIFDTNFNYRFVYLKELLTYPASINLRKIIKRIKLNNKLTFLDKWFNLLIILFGFDVVKKLIKIDFYKIEDEYNKIQIFKYLIAKLRTSKCNSTCPLCMEEFKLNSPIQFCKNGHTTHLSCSITALRTYLISVLKRYNDKKLPELKQRQLKSCCMCRCDNYELSVSTETHKFNHELFENPFLSGICRSGESLLNYGITNYPNDLKINSPMKVSHLLYNGSSKKYLDNRIQYLIRNY